VIDAEEGHGGHPAAGLLFHLSESRGLRGLAGETTAAGEAPIARIGDGGVVGTQLEEDLAPAVDEDDASGPVEGASLVLR
jgi:hypothetical protein